MHFIFHKIKNNILAFYINNSYRCTLVVKNWGVMIVRELVHDED
jgi:hypothetical protein